MSDKKRTFVAAKVLNVEECATTATILEAIHFDEIIHTDTRAIVTEVAELFRVRTLKQLIDQSAIAARHLVDVGLFVDASVVVDVAKAPNSYVLNFHVVEHSPINIYISSHIQHDAGIGAVVNAGKSSALGAGELAHAAYEYGMRGTHSFSGMVRKPFLGWQRYSDIAARIYRQSSDAAWNKVHIAETGGSCEYANRYFGNRLRHTARMHAVWRRLDAIGASTAFAVREHAGHTLKTSIENVFLYDSRDSHRNITTTTKKSTEMLARLTQEYAGLIGDVGFIRHQVDVQAATPLPFDCVLTAGATAAWVHPLAGRTLHLLDRVYIGGAGNLRGFAVNCVGARVGADCFVGGMGSSVVDVHVYRPLRPITDKLFAHVFGVAGTIHDVDHTNTSLRQIMRRFNDGIRMSTGAGIVWRVASTMQIEFNYVVPMRYATNDRIQPGFQIGFGNSIL